MTCPATVSPNDPLFGEADLIYGIITGALIASHKYLHPVASEEFYGTARTTEDEGRIGNQYSWSSLFL